MNENVEMKRDGENRSNFVSDLLTTSVKYFKWIVLAIVLVILFSGLRTVKEGEVAVILRFGKLAGETREEQIHEPGLLFAFPYVIDEVVTVPTGKVFETLVDTHYTEGEMGSDVEANGYCITGDHNVVVLSTSLKYTISDPVAYALYVKDVDTTVRGVVSSVTTSYVASIKIDSLLTDGKDEFIAAVLERSQQALDRLACGVTLSGLEIVSVAPPAEVKLVFDNVNTATVRQETAKAEAEQYREMVISTAKSQVDSKISAARVNQNSAVSEAQKLLAEFYGLLKEYDAQPDVVILRVYHEKLAELYKKVGKIVYVEDEENPGIILP